LLVEVLLEGLLNELSGLSESSARSVWDLNEEVLSGGSVTLSVVNELGAVDEDDTEVLFLVGVISLKGVDALGDFFLEVGWLFTVFLDYFI